MGLIHSLSHTLSPLFFFFLLHTLSHLSVFPCYPCLSFFSFPLLPGRSCLFPFEDGFLDDGHGDPSLTPGLNSPTRCQNGERMERYSRKVFVGGLPPDIDEGKRRIHAFSERFSLNFRLSTAVFYWYRVYIHSWKPPRTVLVSGCLPLTVTL